MEKHLFQLKFSAKELNRASLKCEKEVKSQKFKCKQCIAKGNMEGARIAAENSIRNKNQSLQYLKMSSRIDAVAARVQTALTTQKVTKSMSGVVSSMEAALRSMNLEKVSNLMDKFESQFESLDVQSQVMDKTMDQTTTLTVPQNEVNSLMAEAADEAGIELDQQIPSGVSGSVEGASAVDQDDLTSRLAQLRYN